MKTLIIKVSVSENGFNNIESVCEETDSGQTPLDSSQLFELSRDIGFQASYTLHCESALKLTPGSLYFVRAGGHVSYYIVDRIDNGHQVYVFKSEKTGRIQSDQSFIFMECQQLTLVKNQPAK